MSLFSKLGIYAVIIIALVSIGGLVFHKYNAALLGEQQAKADLATSQENVATANRAIEAKQAELDRIALREKANAQLLKEKNDEADAARATAATFKSKYDALKRAKPAVQQWAATPIPADVLELLRASTAPKNGGGQHFDDSGSPHLDDLADPGYRAKLSDH